ncbi:MAG: transglutaminase family protein [Methylococcaceae bacterium]
MKLKPVTSGLQAYLKASPIINCNHPEIIALAQQLAEGQHSDNSISKLCFEWVRDNIKHSFDFKLNPVTCCASDVLKYKTGYCYAKSHLLAALLRANNIPTGLCYQRLSIDDNGSPYCLHGLNAVFLQDYGWYRIDPRGNKDNIDAQFVPPHEQLAFNSKDKLEIDFQEIWPEPLPIVVETLQRNHNYHDVYLHLPDYTE